MSNPIMYVFWKYDIFPYVLGGEAEILPDGSFKPLNYGGSTFSRASMMTAYPVEAGREIKKVLERETNRVREEQAKIQHEAELRIGAVFHEYHDYRGIKPQMKG